MNLLLSEYQRWEVVALMNMEECCRVLGITPGASNGEIKRAYRDLVKVWHPDRFSNDLRLQTKAQERLKQINVAYEALIRLSDGMPSHGSAQRNDGGRSRQPQEKERAERVRQELERQRCYREEKARRQSEHGEKHFEAAAARKTVRPRLAKILFVMATIAAGLAFLILLTHLSGSWRIERLTEAAEKGDVEAQINLAAAYLQGRGVGQSYTRAYMWFAVAAARGDQEAIKAREKVAKMMTSGQIARGKAMARRWKPKTKAAGELEVGYQAEQ